MNCEANRSCIATLLGGRSDAVQNVEDECRLLSAFYCTRQLLAHSTNPVVRSTVAAAFLAKGTTKLPDPTSAYNAAAAHHLAQLLTVWVNRAQHAGRLQKLKSIHGDSAAIPPALRAVELPPLGPESQELWFKAVAAKIDSEYGGEPLLPGSHQIAGLPHDFHAAMSTAWAEHRSSLLASKVAKDESHLNQHIASVLRDRYVQNLRKAVDRVLRAWPCYQNLVPFGQLLATFSTANNK